MTQIRCFVAVPVTIPGLRELVERMNRVRGMKGVALENLHITLKFLGDVEVEKDLTDIMERLRAVAERHTSFYIRFRGTGAFPNMKRLRVAWVGIESEGLLSLGDDVVSSLPYRLEENSGREFNPHLTIGRLKHPSARLEARNLLEKYKNTDFGEMKASAFYLMKSTLSPSGPFYSKIESFPLKDHMD